MRMNTTGLFGVRRYLTSVINYYILYFISGAANKKHRKLSSDVHSTDPKPVFLNGFTTVTHHYFMHFKHDGSSFVHLLLTQMCV